MLIWQGLTKFLVLGLHLMSFFLGVDSPFFSTIVPSNSWPFSLGVRRFSRKIRIPGKNGWKVAPDSFAPRGFAKLIDPKFGGLAYIRVKGLAELSVSFPGAYPQMVGSRLGPAWRSFWGSSLRRLVRLSSGNTQSVAPWLGDDGLPALKIPF